MINERLKYGSLLTGLLIIMSGTIVHCQSVVKCYNETGNSICFAAETNRDTRLRNWTAAVDFCRKLNGTNPGLPMVNSPLAQFHLSEFLVENDFTLDSIWLGGHGFSSGWTWVDGRAFTGSPVTSSMELKVAAIEKQTNGNETQNIFVGDSLSQERDGYICQYKGSNVCNAKKVVAHYYYDGSSSCFVRYDESINWYLARNKCLMRGGDLAILTDTTDAGIKQMLDNLEYSQPQQVSGVWKRFWIGLREIWWKWASDNSEIKTVYFKDSPTLEKGNSADQNCLAVDYKQQFAWGIRDCSVPLQTICQVGGWTDTTQMPSTDTTGQSMVSLPAWAVGLICGLAILIYIVSLIVVGIVCCKCCGKRDQESHGNGRQASTPGNGRTTDEDDLEYEVVKKGRDLELRMDPRKKRRTTDSDDYELPSDVHGVDNQPYANSKDV